MKGQALFTLDLGRCTGCAACAIACRTENSVDAQIDWRQIHTFNEYHLPQASVFHYSLACNHCLEPACLYGCPANAYSKDPGTGAVLLDGDRCIGCQYCTWVCPFGAPQFNPALGTVEKCTFCSHRLERALEPACVDACPVEALGFIERGTPDGLRLLGFPETGLQPAIRLEPGRGLTRAPVMTDSPEADPGELVVPGGTRVTNLRSEWPLLTFTFVVTLLVAWVTAELVQGRELRWPVSLAVGLLAVVISTLHLGRPTRAWRAILNLRTSWVSREVVFYGLFLGAIGIYGVTGSRSAIMTQSAVGLGFVTLLSVDMVYRIPGLRVPTVPHSAMTILTASFLAGLLIGSPWLVVPAAVLKLVLYLSRPGNLEPGMRAWASVRIGLGFAAPLVVWVSGQDSTPLLLAGPLVGELVDRAQFYGELEFLTPQRQIDLDLRSLAAAEGP